MILVDSSVWIDYFNGKISFETGYLDAIVGKQIIIVADIVLIEVLQGFKMDKDYTTARDLLELFPLVNILDEKIAKKSISTYRNLRKKGITIRKTIDCVIASYCILNKMPLLHSDRDFLPFRDYMELEIISNRN